MKLILAAVFRNVLTSIVFKIDWCGGLISYMLIFNVPITSFASETFPLLPKMRVYRKRCYISEYNRWEMWKKTVRVEVAFNYTNSKMVGPRWKSSSTSGHQEKKSSSKDATARFILLNIFIFLCHIQKEKDWQILNFEFQVIKHRHKK